MSLSRDELTHVTGILSDEKTVETTLEELRGKVSEGAFTGETMLLNMGPQHPSTHGVLRLLLELDGENIVSCLPDVGFLHTGIEKDMESKTYEKALVMADRIDYLNFHGNNLVYSMAVEKLCEIDVPPRAQYLRVIVAELQRISSHLRGGLEARHRRRSPALRAVGAPVLGARRHLEPGQHVRRAEGGARPRAQGTGHHPE